MRITPEQHRAILRATQTLLGREARVRLFGSRTDDTRRGGDFDLYIETGETHPDRLVDLQRELQLRLDAEPSLEGERVDIVLASPLHQGTGHRVIDDVARREGIDL